MDRPNVLVVCGRNKRRSRTAEYLFKNDMRFSIRSVGLSPKSERVVKAADIIWAQLILVMEDDHKTRIFEMFEPLEWPQIDVLYIEDEYEYLNETLIELLNDKIETAVKLQFG